MCIVLSFSAAVILLVEFLVGVVAALGLAQAVCSAALQSLIHIAPAAHDQADKGAEGQSGGHGFQHETSGFIHGDSSLPGFPRMRFLAAAENGSFHR